MLPSQRTFQTLALLCFFTLGYSIAASHQETNGNIPPNPAATQEQAEQEKKPKDQKEKAEKKERKEEEAQNYPAVLWRDPGDISTLDMINGAGGAEHAPKPGAEYTFIKEDTNGTATKFYVKDSDGVEWLAKLGPEAKPETAATRFAWAMGYFTDEDYYLPQIHVNGLPILQRRMYGASKKTGIVPRVRLKREVKKIENWKWDDNPFVGTRELNGLRVLMSLMNNWDLTENNNKVYVIDKERRFVDSDLGAAFGETGQVIPPATKSWLWAYEHTKFIKKRTPDTVSFVMRTHALFIFEPFAPKLYKTYAQVERVAENIPIADAIWMGSQLSKLTPEQVKDAFRTAGYPPEKVDGFARAFESRVAQLNSLRNP
ncbi:MAG TPA: hypothetical protein VLV89_07220 [Candidatus Acidoferrum sp.]|nr:hypothetical protein [Candidatus Acidoferrum sp.]